MENQFKDANGADIVPGCKVLIAVVSYGGSPMLRRGTVYQISLKRRYSYNVVRIGVEVESPLGGRTKRRSYRRPERMIVVP